MALVANTTVKTGHEELTEYRFYLVGLTWTQQSRTNVIETWRAKTTNSTLPTAIGTGTRLVRRATSWNGGGWFDYEETWETPGAWA